MAWLRRHRAVVECSAGVVLLWLVLRVAWMSDDGLINVRAALNLAHGNGAGFNVGERVQAFTSPLWFALEYVVGRVTGEYIVTAIVLGALCAVAAVVLVARRAGSLRQAALVCVAFALSSSLIDFATGGLENGLAMLTTVGFLVLAAWRIEPTPTAVPPSPRRFRNGSLAGRSPARAVVWAACGLAASAVVLTRYDHVLLVAPPMVLLGARAWRRDRATLAALAGGAAGPFVVWSAVSWAYFGSLVPNTLAAKTNVDISRWKLLGAGLNYLWVAAWSDPVLMFVLVLGLMAGAVVGSPLHRSVVVGIVLYVGYLVWIGGDFMAGRFLTTPAIAALWVLATVDLPVLGRFTPHRLSAMAVAAVVLLGAWPMIVARPSRTSGPRWGFVHHRGVADEAAVWRNKGWTLWDAFDDDATATFSESPTDFVGMGALQHLEAAWHHVEPVPKGSARPVLVMCGGLGGYGLAAGPEVFIIDECALTDAFLAGLPWRMPPSGYWRVGHWGRELPAGYEDAVRYGDPSYVQNPVLRVRLEELWRTIR